MHTHRNRFLVAHLSTWVCLLLLLWPGHTVCLPLPLPLAPVHLLRVYDAGILRTMALEEYVACVVAAEMPASYELEALKAQAIAARTRALCGTTCARHSEADICTDSDCCQAYLSDAAQRVRWGADYATYHAKVARAALETRGRMITYAGEAILVLYHAVSGGHTEDVEQVYAQSLPYLRGVSSTGEEHASRYQSVQTFTRASFAETLNALYPQARLSPDGLEEQVAVCARSASGRVTALRLGNAEIDGRALRKAMGLYSTAFTLAFTRDGVVISQQGYGHGVGMSQAGAQAMAQAGADCDAILKHYYTGVQILHRP